MEAPRSPTLTQEEANVAMLIVLGVPATEIGRRLHMSRRTVYRRIAKLKELVGASDRADLTTRLIDRGF